jgi:PKD repeat protein
MQSTQRNVACRSASNLTALLLLLAFSAHGAASQLLSWNNLGMHCMDSDYSVFSILPPYNTIEAQLMVGGKLVTNGAGYAVTYQAVSDPSGSFNSTAMGKGNYYQYAHALFGATLPPEGGLAGWSMPGLSNVPQTMLFEPTNVPAPGVATRVNWWRAEGIPISPFDDAHNKNPYPLMLLVARDAAHNVIATNQTVLPVSDEMDCRLCHASGSEPSAQPAAGWVWDGIQERDFRLNILRLHDEHQFNLHSNLYVAALANGKFNPQGLYRGVVGAGRPVLCAACHASEALGLPSFSNTPPLTASVHARHANVMDPILKTTLDSSANRAACYRCHPGSTTRCLRGAMGGAIASDGSMEMQCQSCHGNMSAVGSPSRVGWFMEPNCQNCHSGTATHNNGQIRYNSAFESNGVPRVPVDATFATTPNTPATGISLYRFSAGHGGLQCSACHGSTHAEFPSTHANDNLRNIQLQGHGGVTVECTACHVSMTASNSNVHAGPHGLHPINQSWVSNHPDIVEQTGGRAQCQVCHGTDYRGTVLSVAKATRSFSAFGGTVTFAKGAQIGCYNCHRGPGSETANTNAPPIVANVATNTANDTPVRIALPVTGAGAAARIVTQPPNGSVGLTNNVATYYPAPGFVGTETFVYLAFDGSKNSGLATGTVTVAQGPFSLGAVAHVPPSYPAQWPAAFAVVATVTNSSSPATYRWLFGDGSPADTNQFPTHPYAVPGTYTWSVSTTVATASVTNQGIIQITQPMYLSASRAGASIAISWPDTIADTLLEGSSEIGPAASWQWLTNVPAGAGGQKQVLLPGNTPQYLRLRRPW